MNGVVGWLLLAVVGSAFTGRAEDAGTGSSTNRLWLEITVGECEASLRDRLPETTSKRLSPEDLAQHNPTAPILTQRLLLPAPGRLTQELKCDEFTFHLDLDCHYSAGMSVATQKTNSVTGVVSSSYSAGRGVRRPSHWNCFGVKIGQPLHMGYVKAGHAVYLIVGRFQLADQPSVSTKEQR